MQERLAYIRAHGDAPRPRGVTHSKPPASRKGRAEPADTSEEDEAEDSDRSDGSDGSCGEGAVEACISRSEKTPPAFKRCA